MRPTLLVVEPLAAAVVAGADTLAEEAVATPAAVVATAAVAATEGADSEAMAVVIPATEDSLREGTADSEATAAVIPAMAPEDSLREATLPLPPELLVAATTYTPVTASVDALPTAAASRTVSSPRIPAHAERHPGLSHFARPNSRRPGSRPGTGPSPMRQAHIRSDRIPGHPICLAISPRRQRLQ